MDVDAREEAVAICLADLDRRRAMGEAPSPAEYREALGDSWERFLGVVEVSDTIDDAIDPAGQPRLPCDFGKYRLLRELGRGAMGVVFEALDRDLDRKVALKMLRTGVDLDEDALLRFRREGRACARVSHPCVVPVHEAGAVDGRLYYTMERLEGVSLARLIEQKRVPPLGALLDGFACLADGLHAAHEAGVVHRDVKPANIVVRPDGRLVLTDFGLARTAGSETITRSGDSIGTPHYMSPEQLLAKRKEVDACSDVYGLGASLYQALTGRTPYLATDALDLVRRVQTESPPAVRRLAPEVPQEAADVVMVAMEKERRDRYATAAAMRDDLRKVVAGLQPARRPVTRTRKALRWVGRHAPAIAAGLIVAVGAFVWWRTLPATVIVAASGGQWEYQVEGHEPALTPFEVRLGAGRHSATPVLEAWERRHIQADPVEFEVGPGQTLPVSVFVTSLDDIGRELLAQRATRDAVRGRGIAVAARTRGAAATELLWPRGQVRAQDLDEWALEYGAFAIPQPGTVRFRVDGQEVAAVPCAPAKGVWLHRGPMPQAVVQAARPGVKVEWAFEAAGGRGATTTFVVAEAPEGLDARLASLAERAAAQDLGDYARVLEARVLYEEGFATAAARQVRAVPREQRGLVGWALLAASFAEVGLEDPAAAENAAQVAEDLRSKAPEAARRLLGEAPTR